MRARLSSAAGRPSRTTRKRECRAAIASAPLEVGKHIVRQVRIKIVRDLNLAFQHAKPQFRLKGRYRHQLDGCLAGFRDYDFITLHCAVDQLRKMRFCLVYVELLHAPLAEESD